MIKDNYSNYNSMFHRYYLTAEGLQAISGIDLTVDIQDISADRWLMKVSDTLYDWLPVNKTYFCYLTATDLESHNVLLKALTYQAEWIENNGLVDEENGVNWDSTTMMDRELYSRSVSPRAKRLLVNSGLLYCGRMPSMNYSDFEETEVDNFAEMLG